ncbi:hypothetical protein BUZ08_00190 [Staphylococcus gallinarum]|uniref:DUF1064 domain-containing protein n=1 Tax=Staphylococcus gallinarum TaxID=1293 RepID=UPI000D1E1104|nr:DUF1064 domain-containing protein [Staphylococcus gallinarum]PTL18610.1 hypothetical protein BUZ08_00190 [Staphylococcus gallinarum]RIO78854.1 DUF1064 domain-containing protein [Staphylococcus gallinarum]
MSKYNAKKVEYKGITFDSKVECDYYKYLEQRLIIDGYDYIEIQPRYELIPKNGKQRKAEYIADFALWSNGKLVEVIDVKGMPTPLAKYKAKHFRYEYPHIPLIWICEAPKYTGKDWITYEELKEARRERKKTRR